MPDHNDDAALRSRQLFKALDTLLETLLEGSDQPGIKNTARALGLLQEDQIVLGQEDEQPALIDHYLFIATPEPGDPRTRIQRFADDPPPELPATQLRILHALAAHSHLSLFESRTIGRTDSDRTVTTRDLVYPDRPLVSFADHRLTPFTALDQAFVMRVVPIDDVWLCTDLALAVPQKMRKFFQRRGPVHEFASLVKGAAGEGTAGTIDDDNAPIDAPTLLRALFGSRLASHLAVEDGETLDFARKRSLARRPDRKRRK